MKNSVSKFKFAVKILATSILLAQVNNISCMEQVEFSMNPGAQNFISNKITYTPMPDFYRLNPATEQSQILIEATKQNDTDLALDLIQCNISIFLTDSDGWTALHQAVFNNNVLLTKILAPNCANINTQNNNGMTALHLAALFNHIEIAQMLTENIYTNADIRNNSGETALEIALERGHDEIVEILQLHEIEHNIENTSQEITEQLTTTPEQADTLEI